MHSRGPNHRLSGSAFRSQVSVLMLAMLTPWHGFTSSAGEFWHCFMLEQHKKLAALEMELAASQQEDFASKNLLENKGTPPKKRLLAVVGIITKFGHKNNRDAICKGMDANW
ncbi:Hydroxyproline O-galactosyltransferase HPGT1 [Vitis vinifera]|uniref:Hydroxyproline O-galactosyltransferase HPGT1 n=1 Tax=Vitis vinifera TaxID=29760 RepID=A0A438IRI8_VITVI|nr:Hydroxyproline O-galactosyltransferase HPGT1 [Vitis vinifera]